MQRRTRLAVLLVVSVIVAATCLATCEGDAPPEVDETVRAEGPLEQRARPQRRRAGDAEASSSAPKGAAGATGGPVPPDRGGGGFVESSSLASPVLDGPTGRVRVLVLEDGEPYSDGHVCFVPEELIVQPAPWDGTSCSDGAYFGIPLYTPIWQGFDPTQASGTSAASSDAASGVLGPDGIVTVDVPAGRAVVAVLRSPLFPQSELPTASRPRVNVAVGEEVSITLEVAAARTVTGRCLDHDGAPLPGIFVQAIAPIEERPLSSLAETSDSGEFRLDVFGAHPSVRVRAVVPYVKRPLGIYDSEDQVPPIPAETTVAGVVPGSDPIDIWMQPAPLVFIELRVAEGQPPLGHLQIEGLAFDPRSAAWGRLGGPKYRRVTPASGSRRAVIALPRAAAARPLMLWSWGWTITAVDPRGQDRVSVEIPRGRRAGVHGRGWRRTDRLRVVAFCGPPGREMPCIWIDGPLGDVDHWERKDSPVAEIEFQIVRDGVVVGRSARVPAGTEAADDVVIDLE